MRETWSNIQTRQLEAHANGKAVYSTSSNREAKYVGKVLSRFIAGGTCLDVGSGILPKPYYMKVAREVRFTGIDPEEGTIQREYKFIKGVAEQLPFEDKTFDAVLFATSLDHVLDPKLALREAVRVVIPGGYIFVWGHFGVKPRIDHMFTWSVASFKHILPKGISHIYSKKFTPTHRLEGYQCA